MNIEKKIRILIYSMSNQKIAGEFFRSDYKNKLKLTSNIRLNTPIELYHDLVSILRKELSAKYKLTGDYKPTLKELLNSYLQYENSDSEFFWAKNIILINKEKIKSFIKHKELYSLALLSDNYNDCEDILNKIDKDFGISLWTIKNRITLLQQFKGLEAQKRYVKEIKNQLRNGSLLKFIVHYTSIRNEESVSVSRYKTQIENIISKLDPIKQQGFSEFISFNLLNSEELTIEQLSQVVRISYSLSIIDYYESFVSQLKKMILDEDTSNTRKVIGFLNSIDIFNDYRIENMKLFLGFEKYNLIYNEQSLNIYENIYDKQYSLAIDNLNKNLYNKDFFDINILMFSLLSIQNSQNLKISEFKSESTLTYRIYNLLHTFLSKGSISGSKELGELNKIILNYSNFGWTKTLKFIITQESSYVNNSCKYFFSDFLELRTIHPYNLFYLEDYNNLKSYYTFACTQAYPKQYSFSNFEKAKCNNQLYLTCNSFSQNSVILHNADLYFRKGDFINSKELSASLISTVSSYYKRKGYNISTYSMLMEELTRDLCHSISDIYIEDKASFVFLPIETLHKKIEPGTQIWKDCSSSIDLSIFMDIAFRYSNNKQDDYRRYATEDFLTKNNLERASKLNHNTITTFGLKKVVYFLRYLCIEAVMDTFSIFDTSSEVLEERLQICKLLLNIDAQNEDIYTQEIHEILRRQIITSKRQEIDKSRIYVNVNTIKELGEAELEENFFRFIKLQKSGVELNEKIISQYILKADSLIDVPENEVLELLIYMVESIKGLYLSSDIGLDRFISTRIRHGELERTMRVPIQNHNLITKKESKNAPYQSNSYWLSRINTSTNLKKETIDNKFRNFSENFDNLFSKIALNWLQIKTVDKKEGLFNFDLTRIDYMSIAFSIDIETTSLSSFINIIIRYLDSKLLLILVQIREKLNTDGRNKAKTLLKNLHTDILEIEEINSLELDRAIAQARIDLATHFDKVIEWFVPSTEGSNSPYVIEDAISVAEAIIKDANPNFEVKISTIITEEYSIHGQLPIFVDIFINIFDNIIKRSSLEKPKAEVCLLYNNIKENHFEIEVTVKNDLGLDHDENNTIRILKEIKEKLSHKELYSKYVATENHSGLIKIYKSILDFSVIDPKLKPNMDFGVKDNCFEIAFSIPFQIYSLDANEDV